ncbi:MAG TPA: hypothetical protein VD735_01435 [Candidatus Saccharimonadales bacterium]|nr:hypothetical protein [Candidatus Saccharimonadales bacterium]
MTKLKVRVNGQWKWMQTGLVPHPTLPNVLLQAIDGGPDYYANKGYPITAAALDNPNFFPIAVWFESVLTQADIDKDKDTGINTYLELTTNSDMALIRSNGMYALTGGQFPNYGSETIGYMLTDEPDMSHPADWTPGGGYTFVQNLANSMPDDGRIRFVNYGKGVLLPTWGRPGGTEVYLNHGFQQTVSADLYWYTDSDIWSAPAAPWNQGANFYDMLDRNLTKDEAQRACHYGSVVRFIRDYIDPHRGQPVWGFVENGGPFSSNTQLSDYITPEVMTAAVWHSIIAGARGIIYFNHSFGGPHQDQHNFRNPAYAAIQTAAKTTNGQIQSLAAVLNDNFAVHFASVSAVPDMLNGIDHMVKYHGGKFYIFAGSRARNNTSTPTTFTIPTGVGTTATVLFENRTIPIVNGSFSDTFTNGYTIHIYRID